MIGVALHLFRSDFFILRYGISALKCSCFFVFLCASAVAAIQEGRVVGVSDGDTVTILDSQNVQYKVRLAGIDAPEKRQPFGDRSKSNLAAMVFGRDVVVEWSKVDRYRRILGVVKVGGRDINLAQISAGLAWHYKEYQMEQSPSDRKTYAEVELKARESRVGLWQEHFPTAPWDFRHQRRRIF